MSQSNKLALAVGIAGLVSGLTWLVFFRPTLDRAQRALETDPRLERNHGYNWPVFKQPNSLVKLTCEDTSDESLRLCTITAPSIDPKTGATGEAFLEHFACSVSTCDWLDR